MKKILCLVALGSVLAACGSSSSSSSRFKDPKAVSFEYADPTAVSGGSEGWVLNYGEMAMASATQPPSGSLLGDLAQGFYGAASPTAMAFEVFEYLPVMSFAKMPMLQDPRMAILKSLPGMAAATADESLKASVNCSIDAEGKTGSVAVNGCKASLAETNTDYAVSGSASLSGKYARVEGSVIWGFNLGVTYDEKDGVNTAADDMFAEFKGNLQADGALFSGFAQAGYDLSQAEGNDVPADAWNFKVAVADRVDYDVNYLTSPSLCFTTGTITVKRVWTTKPTGTDYTADETAAFVDHSLQLTLTGGDATTCATGATYSYDTVTAALP